MGDPGCWRQCVGISRARPSQWHAVSASSIACRSELTGQPMAFSADAIRYFTEFLCISIASAVAV